MGYKVIMKTLLEISGMSCPNCVRHATEALQSVPGVQQAVVTLDPPHGEVEHDGSVSVQTMIAALDEEGYPAKERA